jgi:hypothetical protein
MDLVDRKAVLETIRRGWGHYPIEQAIMAMPAVALDEVLDERYRQHNEGRGDVKGRFGYWKREWPDERLKAVPDFSDEGWEDRSAIQGTNPGLAELIEANREIERLRKYAVQQHDYFTGKDVPDLIVTTGTDYEEINHEDDHSR